MSELTRRALEAITDGRVEDWDALRAQAPDALTRDRLRELAAIAAIGRAHATGETRVAPPLPFQWGSLEVREHVAHGAHGDVYRAWDPRLERDVALKLLRPDGSSDPPSVPIAEGRLLARIRHPNVVAVFGADRIEGQAGIWMEFLRGSTLREEIQARGPLSADDATAIGRDLCAGLAAIHRAGLLHRDVKAQNIMRTEDGRTVLTDLGAALDASTDDDTIEGTPVYLAPEILQGQAASAASEVYAVGVLLFFVVTGRYPVSATSLDDLRHQHAERRSARLTDIVAVPPRFSAVVERCLSSDPLDRFASVESLGEALNAATSTRHGVMAIAATALAIVVGILVGLSYFLSGENRAPRRQLGATAATTKLTTAREVRTIRVPQDKMGLPSRDGRFYPYVDSDGAIQIWEVITGRSTQVVDAPARPATPGSLLLSPDGGRVAYGSAMGDGAYELRIVNSDRTWPKVLIGRETAYEPIPVDWARDGTSLLCWFRQRDGTADLVLVPIDGSRARPLYTSTQQELPHATLSPDVRFAVTARAKDPTGNAADLIVIGTDGTPPRVVLEGVTMDSVPTWTADGAHIFFIRDSTEFPGSRDAWVLPVSNGATRGAPILIARNLGVVRNSARVAVTDGGELHYRTYRNTADVYVMAIDASGSPAGPPSRISRTELGSHVAPAWSPDGRRIAYYTTRPPTSTGAAPLKTLTIQELQSGSSRTIPARLGFLGGYTPRWAPDGRDVIVWGSDSGADDRMGYYRVDLQTGQTTLVVLTGPGVVANAQWSRDGRSLFYTDHGRGIVNRDLASGKEAIAVTFPRGAHAGRFLGSPDGRSIAFVKTTQRGKSWTNTLNVQTRSGVRRLMTTTAPEMLALHAWTADGGLLFTRGGDNRPHPMWHVPATGGPARRIPFSIAVTPNPVTISPDGRRMAYPERVIEPLLSISVLPVPLRQSTRP